MKKEKASRSRGLLFYPEFDFYFDIVITRCIVPSGVMSL